MLRKVLPLCGLPIGLEQVLSEPTKVPWSDSSTTACLGFLFLQLSVPLGEASESHVTSCKSRSKCRNAGKVLNQHRLKSAHSLMSVPFVPHRKQGQNWTDSSDQANQDKMRLAQGKQEGHQFGWGKVALLENCT